MKLVHQIVAWLRDRDRLTPAELAYLGAEGFLPPDKRETESVWDDEDERDYDWEWDRWYWYVDVELEESRAAVHEHRVRQARLWRRRSR